MDDLESFEFELDPESQDSVPDQPIEPGEELTLDKEDLGVEGVIPDPAHSLEEILGSESNSEIIMEEDFNLEASSESGAKLDSDVGSEITMEEDFNLEVSSASGAELDLDVGS